MRQPRWFFESALVATICAVFLVRGEAVPVMPNAMTEDQASNDVFRGESLQLSRPRRASSVALKPINSMSQAILEAAESNAAPTTLAMETSLTAMPSLPVDPQEQEPTMDPTAATPSNFSETGAPLLPEVLQGGVLSSDGTLKWAHKVMECNRANKIDAKFVGSADDCLTECEKTEKCSHANIEQYPTAPGTKLRLLCKTYFAGAQIVDSAWDYLLHDPARGIKIPDPVFDRDNQINCYMRANPAQQAVARELFGAPRRQPAFYSVTHQLNALQRIGMSCFGVLALLGAIFVLARNHNWTTGGMWAALKTGRAERM